MCENEDLNRNDARIEELGQIGAVSQHGAVDDSSERPMSDREETME